MRQGKKNMQSTLNKERSTAPRPASPLASTLKKYGMAVADYHAVFARQGGLCPICLQIAEENLCVDHDHKTRRRRALLCLNCNAGLGCYKDNPATMRRGADYLEFWLQQVGPRIPARRPSSRKRRARNP